MGLCPSAPNHCLGKHARGMLRGDQKKKKQRNKRGQTDQACHELCYKKNRSEKQAANWCIAYATKHCLGITIWLSDKCFWGVFLCACRNTQNKPDCADRVRRQFMHSLKHRMITIITLHFHIKDFFFLPKQLLTTKSSWHKQMPSPDQAIKIQNVSVCVCVGDVCEVTISPVDSSL